MGRAIIQGSGIQYSITINLSCWLLSSALISNSLNVDKMCIQAQYHWFSHQNNKKQANKNIYNTSYLCGSFIQLVNHENFNLDKPSWAPPSPPYMPEFADAYPLEVPYSSRYMKSVFYHTPRTKGCVGYFSSIWHWFICLRTSFALPLPPLLLD